MHVGIGTASFGTSISEVSAHKVLDTYSSLGGVIIDTANNLKKISDSGVLPLTMTGKTERLRGNLELFKKQNVEQIVSVNQTSNPNAL